MTSYSEMSQDELETKLFKVTEAMTRQPEGSQRRAELSRDIAHIVFELDWREEPTGLTLHIGD